MYWPADKWTRKFFASYYYQYNAFLLAQNGPVEVEILLVAKPVHFWVRTPGI
jgi:hypothetical protein